MHYQIFCPIKYRKPEYRLCDRNSVLHLLKRRKWKCEKGSSDFLRYPSQTLEGTPNRASQLPISRVRQPGLFSKIPQPVRETPLQHLSAAKQPPSFLLPMPQRQVCQSQRVCNPLHQELWSPRWAHVHRGSVKGAKPKHQGRVCLWPWHHRSADLQVPPLGPKGHHLGCERRSVSSHTP